MILQTDAEKTIDSKKYYINMFGLKKTGPKIKQMHKIKRIQLKLLWHILRKRYLKIWTHTIYVQGNIEKHLLTYINDFCEWMANKNGKRHFFLKLNAESYEEILFPKIWPLIHYSYRISHCDLAESHELDSKQHFQLLLAHSQRIDWSVIYKNYSILYKAKIKHRKFKILKCYFLWEWRF